MPVTTAETVPVQPLLDQLDVLSRRLVETMSAGVANDPQTDQLFDVRDRMSAILDGSKPPAGGKWSADLAPLTSALLDALGAERAAGARAREATYVQAIFVGDSVGRRAWHDLNAAIGELNRAQGATDQAVRVALGGAR